MSSPARCRRRAKHYARWSGLAPWPSSSRIEWNYGEYEGLTPQQINDMRTEWMVFRDLCPGGESPKQVGERVDRAIARARQYAGSVALFSHWHLLRVLVAGWVGLSPTAGQHFLLGGGTLGVLGYYRDVSAVKIWNGAIAV